MKIHCHRLSGLFVLGLLILYCSPDALAHKVYVFAWVENGKVYTECSFGDRRVNRGEITVTTEDGKEVISGTTTENGEFSFDVPQNPGSDLVIKVVAGAGHQAEWTVKRQELLPSETQEQTVTVKEEDKDQENQRSEFDKGPGAVNILSGIAIIFGIAFAASTFVRARKKMKR